MKCTFFYISLYKIIPKKNVLTLRGEIEKHLDSDKSKTWEFEKNVKTNSGTTRPVFTHKSEQYHKKAGIKFFITNDDYILMHMDYAESIGMEYEYIGMVVSMLGRTFIDDIEEITVIK